MDNIVMICYAIHIARIMRRSTGYKGRVIMKRIIVGIIISVGIGLVMLPIPIVVIGYWDTHMLYLSGLISEWIEQAAYRGDRLPELWGIIAGVLVLMITAWIARAEASK